MKAINALCILVAIAAVITPKQAMAGDKEKAIIGGLIGGIIIGSVLADDDHHYSTSVSYRRGHGHHNQCSHGRWEWRTEKRWVPGYYRYTRDRCGYKVRTWVSGYHNYHKQKIWVKDCSCGHYDRHNRSDRHYSRHDRNYDDRSDHRSRYDRSDRYDRRDDRRDHRRYQNNGQTVRNF